jgi:hypothetical protein
MYLAIGQSKQFKSIVFHFTNDKQMNPFNKEEDTILHTAVRTNDMELVTIALYYGGQTWSMNAEGYNALGLAIELRYIQIAVFLFKLQLNDILL